jgi:hypothetical protein
MFYTWRGGGGGGWRRNQTPKSNTVIELCYFSGVFVCSAKPVTIHEQMAKVGGKERMVDMVVSRRAKSYFPKCLEQWGNVRKRI